MYRIRLNIRRWRLEYNQYNFCSIRLKNLTLRKFDIGLWLFGVEKRAAYGQKYDRINFPMICTTFFDAKLTRSSIRISKFQIYGSNHSNATEVNLILL